MYVYILASHRRALYIGVTNDIQRRFEAGEDPTAAIEREKQLKGWRRSKKIALIEGANPQWRDISLDFDGY